MYKNSVKRARACGTYTTIYPSPVSLSQAEETACQVGAAKNTGLPPPNSQLKATVVYWEKQDFSISHHPPPQIFESKAK